MAIDNRAVCRRLYEGIWNNREFHLMDELVAADYVHHDPQAEGGVAQGREEYKKFVNLYVNAFPDVHLTIEDEVASGDTVVTRWTATGTHKGDLPGLPRTGRKVSVDGISMVRLRDEKIVESWNVWDALGMMRQLGAAPTEARGRAA